MVRQGRVEFINTLRAGKREKVMKLSEQISMSIGHGGASKDTLELWLGDAKRLEMRLGGCEEARREERERTDEMYNRARELEEELLKYKTELDILRNITGHKY